MRRRARRRAATVAILAAAALGPSLAAQEAVAFRSVSELVRLHVAVFSKEGGVAPSLSASDLRVIEDGRERPVPVFLRPEDSPLEIALAVDVSGSMKSWDSKAAFVALLDQLEPSSCVLLLPFADRVGQGVWGRADSSELRSFIAGIEHAGDEAIYDAMLEAFRLLRDRAAAQAAGGAGPIGMAEMMRFRLPRAEAFPTSLPPRGECEPPAASAGPGAARRRAVVVVFDEVDTNSVATIDDLLLNAWGGNVSVFALVATGLIRYGEMGVRGRMTRRAQFRAVERLAQHTGGIALRTTTSSGAMLKGVERLGRALRGHYVLGYVPAPRGDGDAPFLEQVKVEVTTARDDIEIVAAPSVARGAGRSEGAALDAALQGFHHLAAERPDEALQAFTSALSLAPRLGPAHYGRGQALAASGDHTGALAALERARERAPWLPHIEALLATAHLQLGNHDAAWEHALAAHARGSDITVLASRLQAVAPRTVDLTPVLLNPRVALRVRMRPGNGLLAGLSAPGASAAVADALATSEVLRGPAGIGSADLVLTFEISESKRRGLRIQVRGRLRLHDRNGDKLADEPIVFSDLDDPAAMAEVTERTLRALEAELARGRE